MNDAVFPAFLYAAFVNTGMGLGYMLLNKYRRRETAEDVVHRVVVGTIEEAVAQASSRWAEWEFGR